MNLQFEKNYTLDTFIAVGHSDWKDNTGNGKDAHSRVELFSLTSSIWQNKKDYPYAMNICFFSILAFQKKFIIFGGQKSQRKV